MTHSGTDELPILKEAPIPPSDNNLFLNIPRRGRVKGPGYRAYEKDFEIWRLQNLRQINTAKKWLRGSPKIGVEFTFYFEWGDLYCKDGSVKRLDVQNRLKAICDLLSMALGVDDRHFFRVTAEKRVFWDQKRGVWIQLKILE